VISTPPSGGRGDLPEGHNLSVRHMCVVWVAVSDREKTLNPFVCYAIWVWVGIRSTVFCVFLCD
jgi:hypothetical protein